MKWEYEEGHVGVAKILNPTPYRTLYLAENMSKPTSRAQEVVRDYIVSMVVEVASDHPEILSIEGFDLNEEPEQL